MHSSTGLLADYKLKIVSIEKLLAKIKKISSSLRYEGVERISRTTLFQIEAKHTNEFTIHLGGEYYAEVRAEQAIKLLNVRLDGYREQLKKLQKNIESKKSKEPKGKEEMSKETKYGKEKTVKIEEESAGGVKSYMELIGQENGEDIFNIVEIEGDQEIPDVKTSTAEVLKQIQETIGSLTNYKPEVAAPAPNPVFEPVPSTQTAAVVTAKGNEQQPTKSQKSESQESYSDDDGEGPTDLIMYHREKIDKVPPKKELPPITEEEDKSKPKPIIHPALPAENPAPKKEKKVSFIEEPKSKKEKPKQTKKSDGLPEKISKFKLEKMKEKLMKE